MAKKLGNFSQPNQQELIQNYASLAESNSTLRRKYASKYCKDLVGWIGIAEAPILKIIEVLTKDK